MGVSKRTMSDEYTLEQLKDEERIFEAQEAIRDAKWDEFYSDHDFNELRKEFIDEFHSDDFDEWVMERANEYYELRYN
jgi:hypothetical protein